MAANPNARKPRKAVVTSTGKQVVIPRAPGVVGAVAPTPKFKVQDRIRKTAMDAFKNCFLISLTFKRPGAHKSVKNKEDIIKDGHNVDALSVGKYIMQWPEYEAFAKFESECRDYTERCCVPMPTGVNFFKQGTYIIPKANVNRAYRNLESKRPMYEQLKANLRDNYAQRMREDARALGVDFNPKDYIPLESISTAFQFDFFLDRFEPLGNGTESGIDLDIIEAEDRKGRERIQKCVQAMETGVAEAVMSVYKYLLERLCDDKTAGGKRRHIRAEAMDNKLEIVRQFNSLNLTGNPVLGQNIKLLEEIFSGVRVNELKHDEDVRESIRTQAETAVKQLDKLIVEVQGNRKMVNIFATKQAPAAAAA